MEPTVSVIIPAHNSSSTLPDTLDSLCAQTFQNFEAIVIDDGSTDNTGIIARSYGQKVRCIRQTNLGVASARNSGISNSTGTLLAFLDSDDLWHRDKLEHQVALLSERPDLDATYCGVVVVDNELNELRRIPANEYKDLCRSLLLYSSVIPSSPSTLMVRRRCAESVGGYDTRFSQCADWDFLIRLSQVAKLSPIEEYLVRYRRGPNVMSNDVSLLERDTFAVLDAFFSRPESEPYRQLVNEIYSNHWMILCGSYFVQRQLAESIRCSIKGLRLDPTNVVRILGLPLRRLNRRMHKQRRILLQPYARE
jgi:glycosyltransferase involved in cell wall biosynthesis